MSRNISVAVCSYLPHHSIAPDPIAYLWHVLQILSYIGCVFDQHIFTLRDQLWSQFLDSRRSLERFDTEMIAAHTIFDNHVERCGGRSFFKEAAYMEAMRIASSMDNLVDGPLIAMEGEDDGFLFREVIDKCAFIQTMWMEEGGI